MQVRILSRGPKFARLVQWLEYVYDADETLVQFKYWALRNNMTSESKLKYECLGGLILFTEGEWESLLENPLNPRYERDTEYKPKTITPRELTEEEENDDWYIESVGKNVGIIRFRKKENND